MSFIKKGDQEKIIKVISSDELEQAKPNDWKEDNQKTDKDGNKIPSVIESKDLN